MARSQRYVALTQRLRELRTHLLPGTFDPTKPYSLRQVDRILGYRLLTHAEFEAYIEDMVRTTANEAWTGWQADRQPRACLMALLAYYEGNLGGPPETLTPTQANASQLTHLHDRIDKARNYHINKVVFKNNGVREKNVLGLLLPVGIQEPDIDKTWLATIDSFGQVRGRTAHNSGAAQQPRTPSRSCRPFSTSPPA